MKKSAAPQKELSPAEVERTQRAWVAGITEEDRREARKDRALRKVRAFMLEGTEEGRAPRASMPAKEAAVYAAVVKALTRAHTETV